jgi:hypothetical protein
MTSGPLSWLMEPVPGAPASRRFPSIAHLYFQRSGISYTLADVLHSANHPHQFATLLIKDQKAPIQVIPVTAICAAKAVFTRPTRNSMVYIVLNQFCDAVNIIWMYTIIPPLKVKFKVFITKDFINAVILKQSPLVKITSNSKKYKQFIQAVSLEFFI